MERAGRILGKLRLPRGVADPELLARAAWPVAVGAKIAARTRVRGIVRESLVIEVEDQLWQRQLASLSKMIVRNVNQLLGQNLISDLDFRPMPPRREAQRAASARRIDAPAGADEADAIQDPVLQLIYLKSRKQRSA
jgi:hypothetical protein